MAGLTYANQVGAARGMNQAAPGTFIPEDFVRWSQDIFFDRVGLLRRRAPFETISTYASDGVTLSKPSVADERMLGVISTLNVDNEPVFGVVVTDPNAGNGLKIYFYDKKFILKDASIIGPSVLNDAILFSNPALNGGAFIGFMDEYGIINTGANDHYLYYWRGGYGEHGLGMGCNLITTSSGSTETYTNEINNYAFPVVSSQKLNNVVTLYAAGHTFNAGDTVTVNMSDINFDGTFQITAVLGNSIEYVLPGADIPAAPDTGTITANFSTNKISKGMFAVASMSSPGSGYNVGEYYLGVVKEVTANAVYLEKDIIRISPTYSSPDLKTNVLVRFYNVRQYIHSHGRGLISYDGVGTTITSGPIGSLGEGHFSAAGIDNTWALYRHSDGAWIGNVDSVPDNETIILNNSYKTTIKMAADEYVARKYQPFGLPVITSSGTSATNSIKQEYPGLFNTTYAGYQWFGNGGLSDTQSSIVFSSSHDPEAVDLSLNASDSIIVPATQQMRGMAASVSGLLIFFENKTYLLRGNSRYNFNLEELYPEGCLSAQSIVEFGGGVFWASKKGILLFDGATVRNLTEDNLGAYYTDSVKAFDATTDTVYSFVYKDYLFMHFTNFNSVFKPVRYEPIYAEGISTTPAISNFQSQDWDPDFEIDDFDPVNNVPIYWDYITMYGGKPVINGIWSNTPPNVWGQPGLYWGPSANPSMVFAIYLPTNAITTISNFSFRGFASYDNVNGVRGIVGVNAVNPTYDINNNTVNGISPRLIDLDSLLDTKNDHPVVEDSELCENPAQPTELYYKGPDFYLQTKHYTFGDPTLRKWFRQLFLNLYLIDGGLRLDIVDNEDKDLIDIEKKRRRNWDIFVEDLYNWGEIEDVILPKRLSPDRSTWGNVAALGLSWYEFSDAQYERRKKKFSWRYPSMGFRLYQMNKFRPRNYQTPQRPHTVELDSWSIGFKPMRQSRV